MIQIRHPEWMVPWSIMSEALLVQHGSTVTTGDGVPDSW